MIPARGGSKRIPGKNIRDFCGRPMIGYSIDCALKSGIFDQVIVSTDDPETSRIARERGAEVPFTRPAELSDDHTGTTAVMAHAVEFLHGVGIEPTAVCCIYATAPFLSPDDLTRALGILDSGRWDFVFSATTYPSSIFRSFRQNADGGIEMFFPEHFGSRSQDLPEALHDAGQFYWGRPLAWLEQRRIFGSNSTALELPRWRVQDIDTEDDWAVATAMMTGMADIGGGSA